MKKVGELLNKRSEIRLRSIPASGMRLSMTGCAFSMSIIIEIPLYFP